MSEKKRTKRITINYNNLSGRERLEILKEVQRFVNDSSTEWKETDPELAAILALLSGVNLHRFQD